jgi:hypothetical protein
MMTSSSKDSSDDSWPGPFYPNLTTSEETVFGNEADDGIELTRGVEELDSFAVFDYYDDTTDDTTTSEWQPESHTLHTHSTHTPHTLHQPTAGLRGSSHCQQQLTTQCSAAARWPMCTSTLA